jgi:methylmalonyl-CoA mutase N-terminal domain/subunit
VNRFQVAEEPELHVFEIDETTIERQLARLEETRTQRDNVAVAAVLERLREVSSTDENVMPAVLDCVNAYATTGEVADVWRSVFGNYRLEATRL